MNYYFNKVLSTTFDDAIARVTEKLKAEGFGIISEIKINEKLKEKIGVDFKRYTILGACNPRFAYSALQREDKIGTMLPCNVIVIDQGKGTTEIAAINPLASMGAVNNPGLNEIGEKVAASLRKVIDEF